LISMGGFGFLGTGRIYRWDWGRGLGRFRSPGWARVWQEGAVWLLFLNPNSSSNHFSRWF
jgi:hypothetical protein